MIQVNTLAMTQMLNKLFCKTTLLAGLGLFSSSMLLYHDVFYGPHLRLVPPPAVEILIRYVPQLSFYL